MSHKALSTEASDHCPIRPSQPKRVIILSSHKKSPSVYARPFQPLGDGLRLVRLLYINASHCLKQHAFYCPLHVALPPCAHSSITDLSCLQSTPRFCFLVRYPCLIVLHRRYPNLTSQNSVDRKHPTPYDITHHPLAQNCHQVYRYLVCLPRSLPEALTAR